MDGDEMVPLLLVVILATAVAIIIWGPWVFG